MSDQVHRGRSVQLIATDDWGVHNTLAKRGDLPAAAYKDLA